MTWVLTAAILCGSFWVCCTSLSLRLKPPDTRATGKATPVQIPGPPGTSSDERVARHAGQVTNPDILASIIYAPSVTANTLTVTANTSSVTANTTSVPENPTSVTADTNDETAITSFETADTSFETVDTNIETAEQTSANTSITNSKTNTDTNIETADTNVETTDKNNETPDTSIETTVTNRDTVYTNTNTEATDTNIETADQPSVKADTKTATVDTNIETADTNIETVAANITTTDTNIETVDANIETADANIEISLHLRRGLMANLEGDRITYVMNKDPIEDCAVKGEIIVLNNVPATSNFTQGMLNINFRLDNVTVAPVTPKRCSIKIKRPSGVDEQDHMLIKILHLEFSPVKSFSLYLDGYHEWDPRTSLELPYIAVARKPEAEMIIKWERLPKAFCMELQFAVIDPFDDKVTLPTSASSVTGFVRTAHWDGLSAYLERWDDFLAHAHHVNVPQGHHAMISWEHVGTPISEDCDEVCVDEADTVRGRADDPWRIFFGVYKTCGPVPPLPRLLAWKTVSFSVWVALRERRTGIFTGYSVRYSFHNTSAVPQQLTDRTWNCSVPHWLDFKQHLHCNLLTECAGGEDEADCVYTTTGTCRHGYMAAGGSCFTFGHNPGTLTSWAEAEAACRSRGARLPKLHTPAKWRAVLDLLSHRGWENIYIGLSSADPSLPDLYRHVLQWSDSTVAYYVKADFLVDSQGTTCAFLKKSRRPDFVYMDSCFTKVPGSLLCEEVDEGSSQLQEPYFKTAPCVNAGHEDHVCESYAGYDACNRERDYMHLNCQKACDLCDGKYVETKSSPLSDSCFNDADDYDCNQWAKGEGCLIQREFMYYYCKRACGHCNTTPSPPPGDATSTIVDAAAATTTITSAPTTTASATATPTSAPTTTTSATTTPTSATTTTTSATATTTTSTTNRAVTAVPHVPITTTVMFCLCVCLLVSGLV